MTQRGSQIRASLEEAGLVLISHNLDRQSVTLSSNGNLELWQKNDHYAGFVVVINGVGYEFIRSLKNAA